MNRIARIVFGLALLVALAGLYGFYQLYGAAGVPLSSAALSFLAAFGRPIVFGAALTSAGAFLAARWLDRRPRLQPMRPQRHRLADLEPHSKAELTPLAGSGELARLRRRLSRRRGRRLDISGWLDELLAGALELGASDIHLQPLKEHTRVTLRLAGQLEELIDLPATFHEQMIRRLKVLAGLVPYQTTSPQDGRIGLETARGEVDLRISVLPTHHGEKVVLRYVRGAAGLIDLEQLGMDAEMLESYRGVLRQPQGLVILTGPTGSGKTTTIYSSLARIHQERGAAINIATLENPIEVELPFLNQTQIEERQNLSFAQALRAVLRQDPNILMIGEIRDGESARIALQASLTGHLILTTLHADSAVGTFHRLIDIGVEPFVIASALQACVSQRLARSLCPQCRRPVRLKRAERVRFTRHGLAVDGLTFYRAPGCQACDRRGFAGRTGIFELLRMTPDLQQMITHRAPADRLLEKALEGGMKPLARATVEAAARGRIALDEALEIIG